MESDWLKHPEQDYWSTTLGPLSLVVFGTMYGNFSYTVSDDQVRRGGNVGDFELAKAEAVRSACELSSG